MTFLAGRAGGGLASFTTGGAAAAGGGGKGRPTMEPAFLGRVLDRVAKCDWCGVTGESGAEPLRRFFRGGATGVATASPLGGRGGRIG